jgi:magnesium-transporting ATPase (P-type)
MLLHRRHTVCCYCCATFTTATAYSYQLLAIATVTTGHVDTVCYDKTGTLTREGDTLMGIIPATSDSLATTASISELSGWGLTKVLIIHS